MDPSSNPGGSSEYPRNRLFEQSRHVRHDAEALATSVGAVVEETEGALRTQLERRPYVVLGAAAGAGYVLGGGLPSKMTRLLVGIGLRAAASALIGTLVAGVQED